MGKYLNLEKDAFSIFASDAWKAENIKTYPVNFLAVNQGNEFIKVMAIPSGNGINIKSVSGLYIIDIFTPVGNGPNRVSVIADKLDNYLVGKSIKTATGSTQLGNSSLQFSGVDKDNAALFRASYSIPFNYFEVQ